ncbi:MAG: aromatic amino acid lyase [Rubrobacteraceae bacterium]|nr:aromatic amino acid lyase [Rubrobacteraceae bacterium]
MEAIAFRDEPLGLHHELLEELRRSHDEMVAALSGGQRVYGVNTGLGYLAGTDLRGVELGRHQRNLLLGRAVGSPPYLPAGEARALLAVRLINLCSGYAGVTPELCRFLVDRLNDGYVPAVPRGGAGSAGEVIPLSHAFQTFIGVGHVLDADGGVKDAALALAERGVAPYEPVAKEGIALLAGCPGEISLAIARRRTVAVLSRQLLAGAACSIDALRAPLGIYGERGDRLHADPVLFGTLLRLRAALRGSAEERFGMQAPVSFRVAPQVLAHVERAITRFTEDIDRAVGSVTDSPAFVDGSFVATGAFHEVELAAGFDTLSLALIRAAELSGQRVHRLLDSRFSGLPDQLTPNPGPSCGLIVVQKRVVGTLNELRRLATPASVGSTDTSLGQEDAMTFAFEAAEKLRRVEELVRDVLACELLVARQAWALRGTETPAGLVEVAGRLTEAVAPVEEDRPLGTDLSRLVGMLERGQFGETLGQRNGRTESVR